MSVKAREGTSLCLSGGGYRAMVYHIGALIRMNEAGLLRNVDLVSSVSGGSITSATLALGWKRLDFDAKGVATNLDEVVVGPLRAMSRKTIDVKAVLLGLLKPDWAARSIARAYDRTLLHGQDLQALPSAPEFQFNATNMQSGVRWQYSRQRMGDYRVGYVEKPRVRVARAVAASSGFPPILSPTLLNTRRDTYKPGKYTDLGKGPDAKWYQGTVVQADGGVYDNLGLQPALESKVILVSNGSGPAREEKPVRGWKGPFVRWYRRRLLGQFARTFNLINAQVRSLRKRMLFREEKDEGGPTIGYWHIWMDYNSKHFAGLPGKLPVDEKARLALAGTPTRLKAMDDALFEGLVNWGYASCDVVLRKFVDTTTAPPVGFPYPGGVKAP